MFRAVQHLPSMRQLVVAKVSEGAKFFATKNYDAMDVDGTKLMDGNFCIYNINWSFL